MTITKRLEPKILEVKILKKNVLTKRSNRVNFCHLTGGQNKYFSYPTFQISAFKKKGQKLVSPVFLQICDKGLRGRCQGIPGNIALKKSFLQFFIQIKKKKIGRDFFSLKLPQFSTGTTILEIIYCESSCQQICWSIIKN